MAITFSEVPANALVPFTYVEINPANAGAGGVRFRSLLIGQRLVRRHGRAGSPDPHRQLRADARSKFGAGSQLAIMAEAFRRVNPIGQLWGVALDDAAGATAGHHHRHGRPAPRPQPAPSRSTSRGRRVAVGVHERPRPPQQIATAINTAVQGSGRRHERRAPGLVRRRRQRSSLSRTGTAAPRWMSTCATPTSRTNRSRPASRSTVAAGTAGATDPDHRRPPLDAVEDEKFDVIGAPVQRGREHDGSRRRALDPMGRGRPA